MLLNPNIAQLNGNVFANAINSSFDHSKSLGCDIKVGNGYCAGVSV